MVAKPKLSTTKDKALLEAMVDSATSGRVTAFNEAFDKLLRSRANKLIKEEQSRVANCLFGAEQLQENFKPGDSVVYSKGDKQWVGKVTQQVRAQTYKVKLNRTGKSVEVRASELKKGDRLNENEDMQTSYDRAYVIDPKLFEKEKAHMPDSLQKATVAGVDIPPVKDRDAIDLTNRFHSIEISDA